MKAFSFPSFAGFAISLLFTSCSSYQQQAGLIGGLEGAGLGATSGDDHQDVIAGGAAGAGLGAGGAALHEESRQDQRQYERYGIPPDQSAVPPPHQGIHDPRGELGSAPEPTPSGREYPIARRTNKPDEVESPYPPNHRININGFSSGQLAKDPKNGKIFRVP